MFASLKPLPIWMVWCAILVSSLMTIWCNVWLFRLQTFRQIQAVSWGLVSPTLIANLLLVSIVLVIFLRILFGLEFRQMGLSREKFRTGMIDSAIIFMGAQLASLSIQLICKGSVELRSDANMKWFLWHLGELIAQFFGNAFYEEAMFRGVLFSQFVVWLRSTRIAAGRRAVCGGALGSAVFFALQHLPNRLMKGTPVNQLAVELVVLLIAGIFFAAIYWRSGNLWTTIGFHAMANSLFYPWSTHSWSHPVAMAVLGVYLLARRPDRDA